MRKSIYLAIFVLTVCLCFAACSCEHEYEEAVTAPASCTEAGVKTFTCIHCQQAYTEEIPMVDHEFGLETETKKATCIKEGEITQTCKGCGLVKFVRNTPAAGHVFKDVVTKEASCNEEGVLTTACTCGAIEKTTAIPQLTHEYEEKITQEATYKKAGTKQYTCIHCGDQYTKSIAKLSVSKIISTASDANDYITDALGYMNAAIKYYGNNKDSNGQLATSYMLVSTGLAINKFQGAYDLCGSHSDLKEMRAVLLKIINRLEYVKRYDTVTTSNYFSIIKDIVYSDVFDDVSDYEKELTAIFKQFS